VDCPCPCVSDILRGVDVAEEHKARRGLQHPLLKGRAADKLDAVCTVVGGIEDPIGRTVHGKDVKSLRDEVPDSADGAAVLHIRPVTIAWREGRAPNTEATYVPLLVDEGVDTEVLDEAPRDETPLKGSVVVAWNEDLVGDWKRGEPLDETSELALIEVRVPLVGGVTGVDDDVDATGDGEAPVEGVGVRDVPYFHDCSCCISSSSSSQTQPTRPSRRIQEMFHFIPVLCLVSRNTATVPTG